MLNIMETAQVNGFMVVRKPALNRDETGRGAFSTKAPCLDAMCYGGVDRMPWFDIDEQLYVNALREPILRARQLIRMDNDDLSGIEVCRDLDTATMLLHYSNRSNNANELIAVRSDALTAFKGEVMLDPSQVEWLGYDVIALGQQSLLRDGVFAVPRAFPAWQQRINSLGLLPAPDLVESYTAAYRAVAKAGQVEDISGIEGAISGWGYTVAAIQIGRILTKE
jgi:hypothetical protein